MREKYFNILNLKSSATEEDIKQAYRFLAKKYHPDINPDPDANSKFLEISEAYEYLLEELKHADRRVITDQDDIFNREYFEEMRRKARERAQEKSRMRYEKLQKEHEAFQESGLYDFVLLVSYISRYILLAVCIFLIIGPVILSFGFTEMPYVVRAIMLFFGGLGLFLILKAGRKYLFAGRFYYNLKQLKKVFTKRNNESQEYCYYSPGFKADALPYKVNMIKIKDIKLHNYGPGQHGVAFNQKSITLNIPRSHHAFIVHAVLITFKISILLSCIFFLGISSFLWRIIIALALTFVVSKLVLIITRTKSTTSYLVTTGLIIRASIWFLIIYIFSYIQFRPFNIVTTEHMYGITVFMLLFDTFLDQFLNLISQRRFGKPIFKQHPLIESYLEKKYQFSYEMPVFSVFYPVYKWFLG